MPYLTIFYDFAKYKIDKWTSKTIVDFNFDRFYESRNDIDFGQGGLKNVQHV